MEFAINNSPELHMSEITKKLFNNKFLSDIQFYIDGQVIYAHSHELMKRSVVFQRQLGSKVLSELKLIPITEVDYNVFLQFMCFIYTDECEITIKNGFGLLKMAVTYKVVRLENILVDFLFRNNLSVQLAMLQFCVVENYQPPFNRIADIIASKFRTVLDSPLFVTIQPEALKIMLKFNRIEDGVSEMDIFNGLVCWINHYCAQHDIKMLHRRRYFQYLIRLIRFPTMSNSEILECVRKNCDLFMDSDCASFFRQMANSYNEHDSVWNSKKRLPVYNPFVEKTFGCSRDELVLFETKFIVRREIILTGLRFGNDPQIKRYEIKLTECEDDTNVVNVLQFKVHLNVNWGSSIIALGESIKVMPKRQYTLGIYYLVNNKQLVNIICRSADNKVMINDSSDSVKMLEAAANLIEISFKPVL